MADTLTAQINGNRTTMLVLHVPSYGAWRVDADFDTLLDPAALAGAAVVTIGSTTLTGTFSPRSTGSFQLQSKCRVIGGKGLLGTALFAKHYHSDAGLLTRTIVADAIREAGEVAGTTALTTERLGIDFVRKSLPASQVLDQVGAKWWTNYAGEICVGTVAPVEVTAQHEILDFDPRTNTATIATDDPSAIVPGSVLRQRMVSPVTVREVEIMVAGGKLRVTAWGAT